VALHVRGEVRGSGGPIRHPDGFYVLAEERFEARADTPDFDLIPEAEGAELCTSRGRLWVWWDGRDSEPTLYRLERGAGPGLARLREPRREG
jgi:hypothetical protein